jgi:SAM-dependent methyltransferase
VSAICRICGNTGTAIVLDFGPQPNSLLFLDAPQEPQALYPLALRQCGDCGFVFIDEPMPPEAFYGEVQNATSVFPPSHLDDLTTRLLAELKIFPAPKVLEIGCNDGYFLKKIRNAGIRDVQGVEPSPSCAAMARSWGLVVETGYFTDALATHLMADWGQPELVICRHVLEHVQDLDDFMAGVARLLGGSGLFVLETPDLAAIASKGDFSTIWEQHVNYFDLPVLQRLLARHGLVVAESQSLEFGGGTLLCLIRPGVARKPLSPIAREPLVGALRRSMDAFRTAVLDLHRQGRSLAAFGAGMRGAMVLNLTGTGEMLRFVMDDNPVKVGRWLPGSRLPVRPSQALLVDMPDICIILPMNSKEMEYNVMRRHAAYLERGGRFMELLPGDGRFVRMWDTLPPGTAGA